MAAELLVRSALTGLRDQPVRRAVVRRVATQVARGTYQAPAEALAERLLVAPTPLPRRPAA